MLLNVPAGQLGEAVIAYCIIVLLCFPLHEFGHAWVATRLGDHIAEDQGRVSLNPMVHIDPLGAIFLAIGGFGWAKPVPFIPSNLRKAPNTSVGIILVSVAGITMNLLLAILAVLPFRFKMIAVADLTTQQPLATILFYIISINLFLAIFNLIPVPPLDGSKILESILPPQFQGMMAFVNQYGFFLLILLILPIGGSSIIGQIVNPIETALLRLLFGI